MKHIITLILSLAVSLSVLIDGEAADYAGFQSALSRSNTLVTSHDKDCFEILTTENDRVTVRGKYASKTVTDFFINTSVFSASKSLDTSEEGVFTAVFSGRPLADKISATAYTIFSDGTYVGYRIEYAGGWFFGGNGAVTSAAELFEQRSTASEGVAALYVCGDNIEVERASETLKQLRNLSNELTVGITDDYKKAKALSAWVAENIYFDANTTSGDNSLYRVNITHIANSTGYANLYAVLLEAQGIESAVVHGSAARDHYEELLTNTYPHEWVVFRYNDRAVFADPAWDSRNSYENDTQTKREPVTTCFDADPLALSFDHRADYAEERLFFPTNEFLQRGEQITEAETTVADTAAVTTSETTADTTISVADTTVATEPTDATDTDVVTIPLWYYFAVGGICVICVILAVVFVKNIKQNKP
ncbi:MAG: hypothetical protein LBN40_04355 [Oscillospiraceae bacterium]|jgi:transglutaminase-like putative cysteine protease|nr:hypothetical protein [Oscillospiraceae bacterium]